MDIKSLRADFPILAKQFGGKPLVYLDNACMSLRPQPVIEAINRYYTEMSACAGRSNHRLARGVTDAVEETRVKVQKLVRADRKEEIIFTRNTTEGLNLVANSILLKPGDEVLTGSQEHNSNLIPWLKLVRTKGIKHRVIPEKADNSFNFEEYQKLLTPAVKLVSIVQTSNLDGTTYPVKEITQAAHAVGAKVMVDGAQSVPHQKIDVQDLGVDFLAFSGHKMLGPTGTGILYGKHPWLEDFDSYMVGGDTVSWSTYTAYEHLPVPEKFEAGLQDYAGIIGLGAAVDYLTNIGWAEIREHELKLNTLITDGVKGIDRLKIIGSQDPALRSGIISFYADGADPHQIALMLDEAGAIMVRSGQHCVHSWFDAHQLKGSVRASCYFYNTVQEAEFFVEQLKKIMSVI
jgi:cysteine desulfurase/selenocysteine lyase